MTIEADKLFLLKLDHGPWRVVSKTEWVDEERQQGFHNTMGRPNEPATGGFSGRSRYAPHFAEGRVITVKYFNADQYYHEPEIRDLIIAELHDHKDYRVYSDMDVEWLEIRAKEIRCHPRFGEFQRLSPHAARVLTEGSARFGISIDAAVSEFDGWLAMKER